MLLRRAGENTGTQIICEVVAVGQRHSGLQLLNVLVTLTLHSSTFNYRTQSVNTDRLVIDTEV